MQECLEETAKIFTVPLRSKQLAYACEVTGDVPGTLIGDPDRLRQVLLNLIGNAVKFTESGRISVHVRKESDTVNGVALHFEVRDTGIGIPADKCKVIFESFRQADGSTTRRYGGTGLGLTICSRLVELMGGTIWVESELGRGSAFHFTAKFGSIASEVSADLVNMARAVSTSTPVEPSASPARLLRVLVAEDNVINQRLATRLLEKRGHSVVVTATGREALTILGESQFDVVLMDVQMPDMDGLQATALIRERESTQGAAHTPIIALTAHTMKGDRERCLSAGMDDFITKPVNAVELIAVVESVAAAHPAKPLSSFERPASRRSEACAARVRCGVIPIIRRISVSCPRWCISCSFTEMMRSKRVREGGLPPGGIVTTWPRNSSERPLTQFSNSSPVERKRSMICALVSDSFLAGDHWPDKRGEIEAFHVRPDVVAIDLHVELVEI